MAGPGQTCGCRRRVVSAGNTGPAPLKDTDPPGARGPTGWGGKLGTRTHLGSGEL